MASEKCFANAAETMQFPIKHLRYNYKKFGVSIKWGLPIVALALN